MKTFHFILIIQLLVIITFFSCKSGDDKLPILGNIEVIDGDTMFHHIPDITLLDQDSQVLKLSMHPDKVIIADFFFTSCPSICPKVARQMLRLYDRYKDDPNVLLISHTIDQRHDSVSVLHRYAQNLGVDTEKWKFATGQKDSIFYLADQYFVSVVEDPSAPMGFDHSGRIILVDKERHVRGFAEGTDPESVTGFFEVVDQLLHEENP